LYFTIYFAKFALIRFIVSESGSGKGKKVENRNSVIHFINSNIKLLYFNNAIYQDLDFFQKRGVKLVKKDFF